MKQKFRRHKMQNALEKYSNIIKEHSSTETSKSNSYFSMDFSRKE